MRFFRDLAVSAVRFFRAVAREFRDGWQFLVFVVIALSMFGAAVSRYPQFSGLELARLPAWWMQVWSVALMAVTMGVSIVAWTMLMLDGPSSRHDRAFFAYPSTIAWTVPIVLHAVYGYTDPGMLIEFLHRYRFVIAALATVASVTRQWKVAQREDREILIRLNVASKPH